MREPTPIANVLSELMARRGFAQIQNAQAVENAWKAAVATLEAGALLAEHTRVGRLRRGCLEIVAGHSTLLQELDFHKAALLAKLREALPDEGIENLRFRLGAVR